MKFISSFLATLALAVPALAQDFEITGDADAGERLYGRQCMACHVVRNDDGEVLAGRNARTGPNLYRVPGRLLGSVDGFRYSGGLTAAGEAGLIWDEATFVDFVQDPTGALRAVLDDTSLRSKMAFRVRNEQDARDMFAFLASLGVTEADGGATE